MKLDLLKLGVRGRGRLVVALAGSLLLSACGQGCGAAPVGNSARRQAAKTPKVWDQSDPTVLVDGGTTYLYGSSNNMNLPVRKVTTFGGSLSASQTDWARNARNAMPKRPAWINPGDPDIWAPSVIKIGSKYWVYFGGHRKGATDRGNDQCIGRASASSPMGPFSPESSPIYCGLPKESGSNSWGRGALDPEVVRGEDNKLYMLVAMSRTKDNIGALKLHSNGKVVGGVNARPTTLVSQSANWHDGVDDKKMTSKAFLENASMVYEPKSKTYLLFYSAGEWYSARYNTGFARCSTPVGPCSADLAGPMLVSSSSRTGPGGLTAFKDSNGTLRAAYSTWAKGHESPRNNPDGKYSRHLTWATIKVSGTSAQTQSVSLG